MHNLRKPIYDCEIADGGRPVTKSTAMCEQGRPGTGKGHRSPAGGCVVVLLWAQTGQAEMYSRASLARDGHQNVLRRKVIVLF